LLLLAFVPAAAPAQSLTAEQAIAEQRRQVMGAGRSGTRSAECAASQTADEIVVCGRGDSDRHRLPLPVEPVPGERQRMLGEPPTGTAALGAGACFRLCHEPVKFNPIEMVVDVAQALAERIRLGPDD
jgi:hypothetical protein